MNKASCLTDKPIQTTEDDNLNAKDYADALCEFIENADTPVTIGIQGGWGSGKTSLISVMQDKLNKSDNILCVPVNAWEHSLFHDTDNKAEVVISLLNGLAEGIKSTIEQNNNKIDDNTRKTILENSSNVEKAIHGIKIGVRLAAMLAAKTLAGVDLAFTDKADQNSQAEKSTLAQEVRNLRNSLTTLIKCITFKGNQVKIVFFIDDLDRVSPPTAIEILDITKNIFDIPNCIFVLAIDYEVIVKGLEKKFGKRTAENEREFRQYFDKIIQIPFTMPTGAYSQYIDKFLEDALKRLGTNNFERKQQLSKDAVWVTGGNPRSIKRIINTLSLLQYIDKKNHKKDDNNETEDETDLNLEVRFIIVGLHINFPEICRKLMEKPNFVKWNENDLSIPWKLKMDDETNNELKILEKDDFFNDEWERVIYRLCVQSSWLKSQVRNISALLNRLLVVLNDEDKNNKEISENGRNKLDNILEGIRVVSIDSDTANIQEFDDKSFKTDRVTVFCRKWHEGLFEKLPDIMEKPTDKNYAGRGRIYTVNLTDNDTDQCNLRWNKNEGVEIDFWINKSCKQQNTTNILDTIKSEYSYSWDGKFFRYYYTKDNITFEDMKPDNDKLLNELVNEAEKVYKTLKKAATKLK